MPSLGEIPLSRLLFLSCDINKKEEKGKQAVFYFCTLHFIVIIHAGTSLNTKRGEILQLL